MRELFNSVPISRSGLMIGIQLADKLESDYGVNMSASAAAHLGVSVIMLMKAYGLTEEELEAATTPAEAATIRLAWKSFEDKLAET